MDKKVEAEFDSIEFEKRLLNLKDTQDSIQAMSAWCLQNRTHHKKIVASWLGILKQGESYYPSSHMEDLPDRQLFYSSKFKYIFFFFALVKVEQRLTLFYLANDVIQYSKRKNYGFVESWGTALQRATTLVR